MRIGIDGTCLTNRRGFGRFSRALLAALAKQADRHEVTVFVDRPSLEGVDVPPQFKVVPVEVNQAPSRAASASGRRRIGDMLKMGRAVARARLDLFYFPASYTFFPVWNTGRVVVTMHDTLALAHPDLVFPTRSGRLAWKAKEYLAVSLADRIVTVSETARRDLIAWFKLPDRRVKAITEGPDPIFGPRPPEESVATLQKFGLAPGERFLLYVGGLSPHKNLLRLIQATNQVRANGFQLLIVGDFGDNFHTNIQELRDEVERLGLKDRVQFTGFVPDYELVHLYNRAYALIQPSLMEGFGLPAVEAMACGTPVISSSAGSMPEVVGNAGLFFHPKEVDAIASKMDFLLADPSERDRLAKLALERASRFTWDEAARLLMACFEDLGSSRRQREKKA